MTDDLKKDIGLQHERINYSYHGPSLDECHCDIKDYETVIY